MGKHVILTAVHRVTNYTFLDLYMCRLGEGCSHVAAILFKIEYAVRNEYSVSRSSLCYWNQVFTKKVTSQALPS